MASTSESTPVPTGCYKCGRPGHWSKDCNAAPAAAGGESGQSGGRGSFSKPGELRRGSFSSTYGSGKSTKSGSGSYNKSAPKEEIPKLPRTRPKLTADLLLSENGLGYVLEKMPDMVTIKAREDTLVRDLRSLLEGYMRWHSHILPYFSFDQFIEKVEKLGSSKRVRLCTRELREKIMNGGKDLTGESNAGDAARPDSKDANPEQSSVEPEKAEEPGGGDHDAVEEDGPAIPVSEEDFEDIFKQGVSEIETSINASRDSNWSKNGIDDDGEQPEERTAANTETVPATSIPVRSESSTISAAAAARMEANRLQALERLRARKAREQLS